MATRTFSDLNLLFSINPVTGDVSRKIDVEAVKASVRHLISTMHYERPFHPEIGCQIFSLLFEPFDAITRNVIAKTIEDVITKFEPRVTLTEVQLVNNEDNNSINIDVYFRINNSDTPIFLTTAISRVR
jgi:phage baseplate assembly protein W